MYAANAFDGCNNITVHVPSASDDIGTGVNRKDKFVDFASFGPHMKVGNHILIFLGNILTHPSLNILECLKAKRAGSKVFWQSSGADSTFVGNTFSSIVVALGLFGNLMGGATVGISAGI